MSARWLGVFICVMPVIALPGRSGHRRQRSWRCVHLVAAILDAITEANERNVFRVIHNRNSVRCVGLAPAGTPLMGAPGRSR